MDVISPTFDWHDEVHVTHMQTRAKTYLEKFEECMDPEDEGSTKMLEEAKALKRRLDGCAEYLAELRAQDLPNNKRQRK